VAESATCGACGLKHFVQENRLCPRCGRAVFPTPGAAWENAAAPPGQPAPAYAIPAVPGEVPLGEEAAPSILIWARIYAGVLTLAYVSIAILGIVMLTGGVFEATKKSKDAAPLLINGVFMTVLGGVFTPIGALAVWAPRRKWTWILNLVLLGKGALTCCLPLALPVLIGWLKPDVRKYYGA
jgi:hypothetical protein